MSITTRQQLNKDYHLIERFFDFDLTETERQAFEQRMENDPIFFSKIQRYHQVDKKIEAQFSPDELRTKAQLKAQWKQAAQQPALLRSLSVRGLSIAAVLLCLVAVGWWLFQPMVVVQPQALALEYAEKTAYLKTEYYPSVKRGLGLASPIDPRLEAVEATFKQQDYTAALELLTAISTTDDLYLNTLLLKGECYVALEEYDKAIQVFQVLLDAPKGNQKDLALWSQALAYLQMEKVEAARKNLEEMVRQRYPLAGEAAVLLKKLDNG